MLEMRRALCVSLLLGSVTAIPTAAYPCGNSVYIRTDEATQLVAEAAKAIEKKQYRRVLELLGDPDTHFTSSKLADRRMELVAIANVRLGSVETGLMSLRWLAKRKPSDVGIQARLAEALSKTRAHKKEALAILEKLEKADLMPDAEAWAVLAALRKMSNDAEGERRASSRCSQVAKDPKACPSAEPQS
jgi:predicted Zn-dependent protease